MQNKTKEINPDSKQSLPELVKKWKEEIKNILITELKLNGSLR